MEYIGIVGPTIINRGLLIENRDLEVIVEELLK
jgi:hypothetical protein